MSWDLKFPQAVARRRPFATLRDAATYVTTFSKFHQNEARWQGAVHGLIQTADGGPIKVARLGVAQASHRAGPSMARSVRSGRLPLVRRRLFSATKCTMRTVVGSSNSSHAAVSSLLLHFQLLERIIDCWSMAHTRFGSSRCKAKAPESWNLPMVSSTAAIPWSHTKAGTTKMVIVSRRQSVLAAIHQGIYHSSKSTNSILISLVYRLDLGHMLPGVCGNCPG